MSKQQQELRGLIAHVVERVFLLVMGHESIPEEVRRAWLEMDLNMHNVSPVYHQWVRMQRALDRVPLDVRHEARLQEAKRLSHFKGYREMHAFLSEVQVLMDKYALGRVDADAPNQLPALPPESSASEKRRAPLKDTELWKETLRVIQAYGHEGLASVASRLNCTEGAVRQRMYKNKFRYIFPGEACAVSSCTQDALRNGLCKSHSAQRAKLGLSFEEYMAHR